jgi:nicotinamide mononucleotide (NMN) deamidase PncC
MEFLKDRRVVLAIGAALALLAGLGIAIALMAGDKGKEGRRPAGLASRA